MARTTVRVPATQLAAGDLPAVCVVSGAPADRRVSMTFRWTPDWTWILLLFGIFPFFIAQYFATQTIPAVLPVASDRLRRYRTQRRQVFVGVIVAVVLVIASVVSELPALAWLGLASLIYSGAALVVVTLGWVAAAPDRVPGHIRLRRVHRSFALQVAMLDAARLEHTDAGS